MRKFSLLLFLIGFSVMVQAQTTAEKVAISVENLRLAMISGDRAALEKAAATDLSYGHSGGKIQDKAGFVESIASGASDFVSIELKNQSIKVTGKTALVRHELHAKTNDGGKPADVHLGILLVYIKEDGIWKMLGRQAFKLPVDKVN